MIEYAEYHELQVLGIKRSIDLGINSYGFRERVIITNDGRQWDYLPEDNIYEQRTENLISVQ